MQRHIDTQSPDAEHPRPQTCLSGIQLVHFSLRYVKEKKNILTLVQTVRKILFKELCTGVL